MCTLPRCDTKLPHTDQHHRHTLLVRTYKPSFLCICASSRMQPFRQALKPGTSFIWNKELDNLFNESKSIIINKIEEGVRIFDKSKPTCLATDWSKTGIGFLLFQKHCQCKSPKPFCCPTRWKTTLVGSRFTHAAETRYAPVEGEALAVVDALDKARYFTFRCENLN